MKILALIIGITMLFNSYGYGEKSDVDTDKEQRSIYLEHYEECKTVNEILKDEDFRSVWCEKNKLILQDSKFNEIKVIKLTVKKFHKICRVIYKDKYGNLFFRLGGSFDDEWGIVIVNNPDNINFDGYPTSVKLLDDCYYFSSYSDDW